MVYQPAVTLCILKLMARNKTCKNVTSSFLLFAVVVTWLLRRLPPTTSLPHIIQFRVLWWHSQHFNILTRTHFEKENSWSLPRRAHTHIHTICWRQKQKRERISFQLWVSAQPSQSPLYSLSESVSKVRKSNSFASSLKTYIRELSVVLPYLLLGACLIPNRLW